MSPDDWKGQARADAFALIPTIIAIMKDARNTREEGSFSMFGDTLPEAQDYAGTVFEKSCFRCGAWFTGTGRHCEKHKTWEAKYAR